MFPSGTLGVDNLTYAKLVGDYRVTDQDGRVTYTGFLVERDADGHPSDAPLPLCIL